MKNKNGLIWCLSGLLILSACTIPQNNDGNGNDSGDNNSQNQNVSVTGVTLSKASGTSFYVGKTGQVLATFSPSNATNKNVTYSSSDETIATVDENGKVTCIKAGSVTITVTTEDGGYTSSVELNIIEEVNQVDENEATTGVINRTVDNIEYTATITCEEGTSLSSKPFETTNDTITFNNITQDSEYSLTGMFNGSIVINASEDFDLTLDFSNFTISNSNECPLIVNSCNNFDLSAKNGTKNYILDTREAVTDDEDISAAFYSLVDTTIKGKGSLEVTSNNNNGIHTKDDLDVKNLTLKVDCKDNALKGNDEVNIESGDITLIARQGDAIKTSNNALSSKGNQKGNINIASGNINIYSACDGIDAAYSTYIYGGTININTDSYSSYSEDVAVTSSSTNYLAVTNTSYKYSLKYYNSDSDYKWITPSKTVSSGFNGGGFGGGGMNNKTYYSFDKPSGYSNVGVYVYSSSQSIEQDTNYVFNKNMTINSNYDTISVSNGNRPGSSSSWSVNWTSYSSSSQQPGGGGMNQGNSNKNNYSSKGIKSNNEIDISGGTIVINSYDDAIHANNDEEIESGATALGNINISGGDLTLTTKDDGIHADQDLTISDSALINVLTSYEGIEANRIYVKGGETHVYATDDACNAAQCNGSYTPLVEMDDGFLDLEAGSGDTDTIDSNGNVIVKGGILIVKNAQGGASSNTGGCIDMDGSFTFSGGTIISCGTWCNETRLTCNITNTTTTLSVGTYYLKNSNNEVIATFTTKNTLRGYRIATQSLASGTYSFYNGSTLITSFTK